MTGGAALAGEFWRRRAAPYGVAALLGHAALLALLAAAGIWLNEAGKPQAADFLSFWTAGRLALEGRAADAWDWALQHQAQIEATGREFAGRYPWHNPPPFLFLVLPFALLPYQLAWVCWILLTAGFFALALRLVLPGYLVPALLAAPGSLWCAIAGQNGFLTAGLILGSLALLERRPVLAGIGLGLLTCKPQFGILFPLFLLAGRHWLGFGAAGASSLALAAAAALAFGSESWLAFLGSLGSSNAALMGGGAAWDKLQSVYALAFQLTGSLRLALAAHLGFVLLLLVLLARQWSRPAPAARKGAAIAAAAFLATPYAYIYDSVILTAAAALLVSDGLARGFAPRDKALILAGLLLPASFLLTGTLAALSGALLLLAAALREDVPLLDRSAEAA